MQVFRAGLARLATLIYLLGTSSVALADLPGAWALDFASDANGPVYAAGFYQGDLVIGGDFTSVGGVSAANVARWDGSSWSAFGSGVNGRVHALLEYQGELYVGGAFSTAGSFNADNIARWTGSFWTPVGDDGLDAIVYSLAGYNGVVATGAFTQADGVPVSRIARWNGSIWQGLGSGLGNTGLSLLPVGTDLYAGGFFSSAGGQSASGIARWDGSSWSAVGGGVSAPFPGPFSVEALAEWEGDIVAAGRFTTAGTTPAANIAAWNGTTWETLDLGLSGGAIPIGGFALTVFRSELVVAGRFTVAGGGNANRIASWDGTIWSMLTDGLNGDGYALASMGTSLFVGGGFTQAGLFPSEHVGHWLAPPISAGIVPDGKTVNGPQLTMRKLVVQAFAALDWGASCGDPDTDYAVYSGTLDDFTSHTPMVCSTGGSTTHAFLIGEDAYYLVVPTSVDFEGGYGFSSDGPPRPASTSACRPQSVACL